MALFPEFHFQSYFSAIPQSSENDNRQEHSTKEVRNEIPAPVLWPVRGRASSPLYKEMRFLGLLLNCPSAIPISHRFGVLFVLYSKLHVYNLHCQLPSRKNEQTWKGQRKILKDRWANLWRNTSDNVLRGKILVSWAIQPVSYPTVPATHDAPLQRGMGERRLFRFLFASFLFSSTSLFLLPTGV